MGIIDQRSLQLSLGIWWHSGCGCWKTARRWETLWSFGCQFGCRAQNETGRKSKGARKRRDKEINGVGEHEKDEAMEGEERGWSRLHLIAQARIICTGCCDKHTSGHSPSSDGCHSRSCRYTGEPVPFSKYPMGQSGHGPRLSLPGNTSRVSHSASQFLVKISTFWHNGQTLSF